MIYVTCALIILVAVVGIVALAWACEKWPHIWAGNDESDPWGHL